MPWRSVVSIVVLLPAVAGALVVQPARSAAAGGQALDDLMAMQQPAFQPEQAALKVLANHQVSLGQRLPRTPSPVLVPPPEALPVQRRLAPAFVRGANSPLDSSDRVPVQVKVSLPWYEVLLASLSYIFLVLIAAYFYGACFTYDYPPLRLVPDAVDSKYFTFSLFDGFRCDPDWRIFCCSCCCLPIRWADTVSSTHVGWLGFWQAVVLFTVWQLAASFTAVCALGLLIVAVHGRQKIRAAYGLQNGDVGSVLFDAWVWCCCAPCATMQEAMQIEFVENMSKAPPEGETMPMPAGETMQP